MVMMMMMVVLVMPSSTDAKNARPRVGIGGNKVLLNVPSLVGQGKLRPRRAIERGERGVLLSAGNDHNQRG